MINFRRVIAQSLRRGQPALNPVYFTSAEQLPTRKVLTETKPTEGIRSDARTRMGDLQSRFSFWYQDVAVTMAMRPSRVR